MINNKKILIAITILTLVAFNVLQFFVNKHKTEYETEKDNSTRQELVTTYAKLDTIATQLDEKIIHIRNLGGSVDSLIEIKNQLELDKFALKQAAHLAEDRYKMIKEKLRSYEKLLALKDEEIARFKHVTKELVDERMALLEKTDALSDEVTRLENEKDRLLQKMSMAATLAIKNIRFYSVSKNGSLEEDNAFKNGTLEKLLITVKLTKNQFAKQGKKQIAIRIIEPEGASLYSATSGTFKYNGKEMFATASTEFDFENKEEEIDFTFIKGNDYALGNHRVEFYCEGQRIGQGDFTIVN